MKELKLSESEIRVILEDIESSRDYLIEALEGGWEDDVVEKEATINNLNACESIIKKLKGE